MTNREYVIEDIKHQLKYLYDYVDKCKNLIRNDNALCDIAAGIYLCDCETCPIDKFCNHQKDECTNSWFDYFRIEGDKEHENNL